MPPNYQTTITDTAVKVFGASASVWLFGSRLDDAAKGFASLQRKEHFAYPLPALREALLNAVVHRDYTNPSDIQIKIFDDSIMFFSPGRFYGGLSVADIQTDISQTGELSDRIATTTANSTGKLLTGLHKKLGTT